MINTVYRTLCDKCNVQEGDRIIVALSGGADSVTLLDLMIRIKDESIDSLQIYAAHINHNLRGDESKRDEMFVRELCKARGVKLFVHSADVSALAKERAESIELCARQVRYEFFERLSYELSAKVATAHTLSDSQETMLYNMCRGTTLHGLCGIPYKRDYIIRPLLDITRVQVEDYCSEHGLEFVQDSTNFIEDMCKRNKLRLAVMPHLKFINDGFDQNFLRLRESLMLTDDFMSTEAEKALENSTCDFGYDAKKLLGYHKSVVGYALAILIRRVGCEPRSTYISLCEQILAKGGSVQLCQDTFAVCKQGIFRITDDNENQDFFEIPFEPNIGFTYKNKKYCVNIIDSKEIVNKKLSRFCIGCDKISDGVVIRTRRSGDTFTPIGRGVKKSLRKLQNELKIPAEKRDTALVVACSSCVLWAEYIGVSQHGCANRDDAKAYLIETDD